MEKTTRKENSNMKFLVCVIILMFPSSIHAEEKKVQLAKGDEATGLALRDINGDWLKLSDYRDKNVVILGFFTTYCKPCLEEIPELEKLAEEYKKQGLKVLLINSESIKLKKLQQFVKKQNIKLPVLCDIYSVTAKRYSVNAYPSLFVVDKKGRIIYNAIGYTEKNIDKLREVLKHE